MTYAYALLPVLAVLVVLLVLKAPVWASALVGLAAALAGADGSVPVRWDAGLALVLSAAMVVVPGLTLNGILEARGVHHRLAGWVHGIRLSAPWKTCLIVLGLGPALESLTGFGVSLLATVPVLLALSPPATAVRQAVLGMAVVPWGALALPTAVGAALSGATPAALGTRTALLYLVLMPVVGGLATFLGRDGAPVLRRTWPGVLCGAAQAALLLAASAAGITSLAGVVAGAAVAGGILLPGLLRRAVPALPLGAVAPYAAVLGTVVAVRLLLLLGAPVDVRLPVGAAGVAPLLSPGLALFVACALFVRTGSARSAARSAASSWRTVCALGGFILMAQVMTASGAVETVAAGVATAGLPVVAWLSPVMALASGFLTGSATSGNALMMATQASLGELSGTGALAPSVQNAGAGIAMLASLPTASLVLGIAGLSGRRAEQALVRFDLRLLVVLAVLLAGCFGLVALVLR
jgi:lactate permease